MRLREWRPPQSASDAGSHANSQLKREPADLENHLSAEGGSRMPEHVERRPHRDPIGPPSGPLKGSFANSDPLRGERAASDAPLRRPDPEGRGHVGRPPSEIAQSLCIASSTVFTCLSMSSLSVGRTRPPDEWGQYCADWVERRRRGASGAGTLPTALECRCVSTPIPTEA